MNTGWSIQSLGGEWRFRQAGDEEWLGMEAPAGSHEYLFRYRPADVWIGLAITLAGVLAVVILWVRAPEGAVPE